ncbi:hypothetical protein AB0E62_39420 [Streptomyces sp. NPDC038707]|uniref:hypothetical protein n=1 Tax=Streptomyces sp. NPDC038707 TaxID=3154329 RepID=UPI0033C6383E
MPHTSPRARPAACGAPYPSLDGTAAPSGVPLLPAHPATCDAVADLLGCEGGWHTPEPSRTGATLLARHPGTPQALEELLTTS